MRIGIIASSAGGVFRELFSVLPKSAYEFSVITDRKCGIEEFCRQESIRCERVVAADNNVFSTQAMDSFLRAGGVDVVFLFFTRLVTNPLFSSVPVFNIHPALLPAFKGFNPIARASRERVRFLGATLHLVDESVDGGPILAQVVSPIDQGSPIEQLEKLSFLQKVYLGLVGLELIEKNIVSLTAGEIIINYAAPMPFTHAFNPSLTNSAFQEAFESIKRKSGVPSRYI